MIEIAVGGTILLFALLFNGMPVGFAMFFAGALGILLSVGLAPLSGTLAQAPYEHVASYTLSTLPMFILMAMFLTAGNFTRDLFRASHKWIGHLKGGVAYAAVAGGVLLSAISGSSTAAASTLAASAYPEMKKYGYADSFSTGALAVIGTLAIMIPPSIGLILYGIFTETSVSRLLMAGIIPGAITAAGYVASIWITVSRKPEVAPAAASCPPFAERMRSLITVWPILLLMTLMIVAIYTGIVTPTEVGAVGALVALLLGVSMRRVGWRQARDALAGATRSSAMIFTIIAGASVFGIFLTYTGVTQMLLSSIKESGISPFWVLMCVVALLLILGFFLDQLAILVLTLPLTFPLLTGLGYDPVWLGILIVKTGEIGLVTPPMGLNAFVVSSATGVPVNQVFRGIWPFLAVEVVVLTLLIAFPGLSLWIPSNM